jgi:hypothetical protein
MSSSWAAIAPLSTRIMNRSKSKKQSKKQSKKLHTNLVAGASLVAAPPTVTAPPVPLGYVRGAVDHRKGLRPQRSQVTDAPGACAEVKASAQFSADFSENVDRELVVTLLERASAWRSEVVLAQAWHDYVRDQDASAWRVLLTELEAFKLASAYATRKDAAIAARYPHLARMLDVRHEAGMRGARTRAQGRAKKAAAKAASPEAPKAPVVSVASVA